MFSLQLPLPLPPFPEEHTCIPISREPGGGEGTDVYFFSDFFFYNNNSFTRRYYRHQVTQFCYYKLNNKKPGGEGGGRARRWRNWAKNLGGVSGGKRVNIFLFYAQPIVFCFFCFYTRRKTHLNTQRVV